MRGNNLGEWTQLAHNYLRSKKRLAYAEKIGGEIYKNKLQSYERIIDEIRKREIGSQMEQAEKGNPNAQTKVGILFEKCGHHKDAMKWFYKAAIQGDHQAQASLGGYRYKGVDGVIEKDPVQAYVWFTLADLHITPISQEILTQCKSEMTKEQIAKADRMVIKYRERYKTSK